jgi:hypothetical protein
MQKILVIALFLPSLAFAQINESDTMLFQARLSLSGNWQTGNVEMLAWRSKADVSFAPLRKVVFKSQNSYLYQEFFKRQADEDIFSRNFLYLNPQAKVYPFAIAFLSTNFRREIDFRYFVGLGLTWQVMRHQKHLLKVSLSGVYENTDFAKTTFNESQYNGNQSIQTWRSTFWLFGRHQLANRKLIFHYDFYAQPSVEQSDNLRWQAEVGLDIPLWKGVSFSSNFIYTYESIVTEKQKSQDSILTFGFSYQFKK